MYKTFALSIAAALVLTGCDGDRLWNEANKYCSVNEASIPEAPCARLSVVDRSIDVMSLTSVSIEDDGRQARSLIVRAVGGHDYLDFQEREIIDGYFGGVYPDVVPTTVEKVSTTTGPAPNVVTVDATGEFVLPHAEVSAMIKLIFDQADTICPAFLARRELELADVPQCAWLHKTTEEPGKGMPIIGTVQDGSGFFIAPYTSSQPVGILYAQELGNALRYRDRLVLTKYEPTAPEN